MAVAGLREYLKDVKQYLKESGQSRLGFPLADEQKYQEFWGVVIVTDGAEIWIEQKGKRLAKTMVPEMYRIVDRMFVTKYKRWQLTGRKRAFRPKEAGGKSNLIGV